MDTVALGLVKNLIKDTLKNHLITLALSLGIFNGYCGQATDNKMSEFAR